MSMMNIKSAVHKYLTMEEIKQQAPSIFTETAIPTASEKYTHIPTSRIISDMEALNWKVVDAKQVKVRAERKMGYQKHLLVFRNEDVVINGSNGDTVYPQILTTNSHDGLSSFHFKAALFRAICSNGLVIVDKEFEDAKIRHKGYTFEELQETIKQLTLKLPLTVESMNKMNETELGMDQALDFARKAVELRHPEKNGVRTEIDLNELLEAQRQEDEGMSVWKVFNRVQERIINGQYRYATRKGNRRAKPLKSFVRDTAINEQMFSLALSYCD
jgi:hypothetical protein